MTDVGTAGKIKSSPSKDDVMALAKDRPDVYREAVRKAAKETGQPRNAFPFDCPYTLDQLRDPDWMPE